MHPGVTKTTLQSAHAQVVWKDRGISRYLALGEIEMRDEPPLRNSHGLCHVRACIFGSNKFTTAHKSTGDRFRGRSVSDANISYGNPIHTVYILLGPVRAFRRTDRWCFQKYFLKFEHGKQRFWLLDKRQSINRGATGLLIHLNNALW